MVTTNTRIFNRPTDIDYEIDAQTRVLTIDVSGYADGFREGLEGLALTSDHPTMTALHREANSVFPAAFLELLGRISSGELAPTALVVAGLPFDPVTIAPAPGDDPRGFKPTRLSENLLLAVGCVIGEPYGLIGEGPKLVNDLIPNLADKERLTGNGSRRRLGFHVENVAHRWLFPGHDLSPKALLLNGVSVPPDGGPFTRIGNGRLAAEEISPEDNAVLHDRCVRLALPLRQREPGREVLTDPVPVLCGPSGNEIVSAALYGDMTHPVSDRVARVLENYESAIEATAAKVRVTPGTLVYIPNRYSLHSRDGYEARFDSNGRTERWLQRIFLTSRLEDFQIAEKIGDRVFRLPGL